MPDLMKSRTPAHDARFVASLAARLQRLPSNLGQHPALMFSPRREGYRAYVFGAAAGPRADVVNLFHELGHAAEFSADCFKVRNFAGSFRFKSRQIFVYDRYCTEPQTAGSTHRELRTFAHQLRLLQAAGSKLDEQQFFQYSARLMKYMPDWWHIPGEDDEERAQHCTTHIKAYYDALTPTESAIRLEGWLDATAARLRRIGLERWQEVLQDGLGFAVFNASGIRLEPVNSPLFQRKRRKLGEASSVA